MERVFGAYPDQPLPMNTGHLPLIVSKIAVFLTAVATFLAAYVEWRPAEVFITVSDVFFMVGACLMFASGMFRARPLGGATSYWAFAYIVMIFGLFIGSVVNGDPVRWLIAAAQYGFGFILIPFIVADQEGEKRTLLFAKMFVLGVALMEAFGAAIYYGYDGSYQDYQKISQNFITGAMRLGAFVGQPNWNAAVIALALPFVFYLRAKRRMSMLMVYLSTSILALGLVLSASFTGFVSALIVLFLFLVVGGSRRSLNAAIVLASAGTILFASGYELPAAFQGRVGTALETGDMAYAGTFTGRMALIEEAWNMVDDTMLVGLGVDQYRVVSPTEVPVHNMYLLLWAEGGLLALLGWMFMLTIAVVNAVRVFWIDRQAAALGLSVISTFLIFSVASPHMYARVWMVPFILALVIVFGKLSGTNNVYQSEYLERR
jgi:hypothetical protein